MTCPSPNPRSTYSRRPPPDGYLAPSFANEYPCNPAIAPAITKDTHTAAPATAPAVPRSAKIPAPTIAPTPMNAAWRTVIVLDELMTPPPRPRARRR